MTMARPRIGVIGIRDAWSSQRLVDAFNSDDRCDDTPLIDLDAAVLDLASGCVTADGVTLNDMDALVVKKLGPVYTPAMLDRLELLVFLARRGVRIYPPPASLARLLDRLSGTIELALGGIPMQPTTITESVDRAVAAIRRYERAVVKPLWTSKARGMTVLEGTDDDLPAQVAAFRDAGNPMMYVQQLIPDLQRDLGVSFVGDEYLATYARVGSGSSWTTTTSQGGKYVAVEPGDDVLELADRARKLFGLAFTCVDIAETADGLRVFEVSAFGGFRGLLEAHKIDAAAKVADHVIRSLGDA